MEFKLVAKNHSINGNSLDWNKYYFDIKQNNQFENLIQETFKIDKIKP